MERVTTVEAFDAKIQEYKDAIQSLENLKANLGKLVYAQNDIYGNFLGVLQSVNLEDEDFPYSVSGLHVKNILPYQELDNILEIITETKINE